MHELLGVGAGGVVGGGRRRGRGGQQRARGAAPAAARAGLAARAARRVHGQPALQQRRATELEAVVRQRLYTCMTYPLMHCTIHADLYVVT